MALSNTPKTGPIPPGTATIRRVGFHPTLLMPATRRWGKTPPYARQDDRRATSTGHLRGGREASQFVQKVVAGCGDHLPRRAVNPAQADPVRGCVTIQPRDPAGDERATALVSPSVKGKDHIADAQGGNGGGGGAGGLDAGVGGKAFSGLPSLLLHVFGNSQAIATDLLLRDGIVQCGNCFRRCVLKATLYFSE